MPWTSLSAPVSVTGMPAGLSSITRHWMVILGIMGIALTGFLIFRVGAGVPQHLVGDPARCDTFA